MNIALMAPFSNAVSETFIQAHKNHLKGRVFFYYGDQSFTYVENNGSLFPENNLVYIFIKFCSIFSKLTFYDYLVLYSFKKNKIKLVFAEYGTSGVRIMNVCKAMKLPLIVHFHGFDAYIKNVLTENKRAYIKMFDYAYKIVVVSNHMKQQLIELGCEEDKLLVNIYGPHDNFFQVKHLIAGQKFVALGRFVEKKAPYYLILAFQKVLLEFPDAILTIGGEGPLYWPCRNIVKALNLENSIKLPGTLTRENFIEYLKSSLAFIQHSITASDGDSEGTPVAILEAMASGVAIISTAHTGIKDLVVNNMTGYIVEEHNVQDMSSKMKIFLHDIKLAEQMGKLGRDRVAELFTMEQSMKVLNDLTKEFR